jgi:hypothetical protein
MLLAFRGKPMHESRLPETQMLKRLFSFAFEDQEASRNNAGRNGSTGYATADPTDSNGGANSALQSYNQTVAKPTAGASTFEEIYQDGAIKLPRMAYNILKVAGMIDSPFLAGMSKEVKHASVLMALEAAGVQIEDLLQDALLRQRALNDFEDKQRQTLKEFETAKMQENAAIQVELDRITSQYMARSQTNMDEVASEQDKFHAWQKRKQQEAERIAEAARVCVPKGAGPEDLTLTMERVAAPAR